MKSIKEVLDNFLKATFNNSMIENKKYTELEALKELQEALKWRIKQVEKELNTDFEDMLNDSQLSALESQSPEC